MNQINATAVSAGDVRAAAERLREIVVRSPLERNERLSELVDGEVWLKREDLQEVRSYKLRGAYNLIAPGAGPSAAHGVVCASAGNHAQGVAWACRKLGVARADLRPGHHPAAEARPHPQPRRRLRDHHRRRARPTTTPQPRRSRRTRRAPGPSWCPPFDDPRTVAGQGTVAAEMLEQLGRAPGPHRRAGGRRRPARRRWRPGCRALPRRATVGVEPAGAACMTAALRAGEPVRLTAVDSFVDGAAVRLAGASPSAGPRARRRGRHRRRGPRCAREMLRLYQHDGIIAEPAGALAAAALGDAVRPAPRRARPSASSPAATTTSAATARSSSARWSTRGSSTTSSSSSRRSRARCGGFLERDPRPGRRHHPVRVRQAQQPGVRPALVGVGAEPRRRTWTRCWRGCRPAGSTSSACRPGPRVPLPGLTAARRRGTNVAVKALYRLKGFRERTRRTRR